MLDGYLLPACRCRLVRAGSAGACLWASPVHTRDGVAAGIAAGAILLVYNVYECVIVLAA
jgi:hypothetical protein